MNGRFSDLDPPKVRLLAKRAPNASAIEVNQAIVERRDIVVVDVRAPEDFAKGHVPGAVGLPREKWQAPTGLSKDKVNVVYCYSHTCPLGGDACAELAGRGYPVIEMDGGFQVWESSALEIAISAGWRCGDPRSKPAGVVKGKSGQSVNLASNVLRNSRCPNSAASGFRPGIVRFFVILSPWLWSRS